MIQKTTRIVRIMTGLFLLCVVAFSFLGEATPVQGKHLNGINFNNHAEAMHVQPSSDGQRNVAEIQFYLYTRRNPTSAQRLYVNNANSISSSNFDVRNPVVVVVHGWLDNMDSSFNGVVRDALLKKSDVNVLVLDWSNIAVALYGYAVTNVPSVGRALGQFLDFVNKSTGAPFGNMHLVGFSLGAHVVGNAGRELGGKVARITGLDPAGPLWGGNSNCLRASDAVYVEAIHTDGGLIGLGIGAAVGDADFFPNGGSSQSGCSDSFCNHNRAWELFAATVTYDHLVAQQCTNTLQLYTNSCRGSTLNMGNLDVNKRGSGLYRLSTQGSYPY